MKNLKKYLFFPSFLLVCFSLFNQASAKVEAVLGLPLNENTNLAFVVPTTSASEIIVSRQQYVISYNKFFRSPNYVAWKLDAEQIGASGRSNNFSTDSELEQYLSQSNANKHAVDPNEYKGSCYDRGHQIPSGDRTDSQANNSTTFVMSNMLPQTSYLNRVIWEHLEQYSRDLVLKQGKKLYIISGPIYDQDMGAIGSQNDIPVPSKNFKLIYILDASQSVQSLDARSPSIAVIMPNILQDGTIATTKNKDLCRPITSSTTNRNDWQQYLSTLSEVERLSGIKITSQRIIVE